MNKNALAAIPVVLELIRTGVPAVIKLIEWLQAIRVIAQQNSEWLPEFEEKFIDALIATASDPKYVPDASLAART